MKISDRIRQLIDNKGVTAYVVSAKTGISQATLSRLLSDNTKKPNISNIEILAKYFEVNAKWLLTGEGEMLKPPKNNFSQLTEDEILEVASDRFAYRIMEMFKSGEIYSAEVYNRTVSEKDCQILKLQQEVWKLRQEVEALKKPR